MRIITATIILIGLVFVSCKKDENNVTPACDGSNPNYNSFVQSVMSSHCISCHSDMATYAGLSVYLNNGSFAKEVLTDQTMPQGGSLDATTLNKLQCWVDNGFPEN
ncbi:MAG: hypothetical protein MK105_01975 [Crocinitomicaceae bacterium]|nr:hypothetical protein [Crocinitomicaceae bacterium]